MKGLENWAWESVTKNTGKCR